MSHLPFPEGLGVGAGAGLPACTPRSRKARVRRLHTLLIRKKTDRRRTPPARVLAATGAPSPRAATTRSSSRASASTWRATTAAGSATRRAAIAKRCCTPTRPWPSRAEATSARAAGIVAPRARSSCRRQSGTRRSTSSGGDDATGRLLRSHARRRRRAATATCDEAVAVDGSRSDRKRSRLCCAEGQGTWIPRGVVLRDRTRLISPLQRGRGVQLLYVSVCARCTVVCVGARYTKHFRR